MIEFSLSRLKAERVARKMSIETVAEALEVHPSTYSKKESGKLKITVEEFAAIIAVLGVPSAQVGIFFESR